MGHTVHHEAAAKLLAPGGRLVALLPESARRSLELPGLKLVWRGPYENQFAGASVSVVMLIAQHNRPASAGPG